jgi:two-component system sensor histidine kinase KdpD
LLGYGAAGGIVARLQLRVVAVLFAINADGSFAGSHVLLFFLACLMVFLAAASIKLATRRASPLVEQGVSGGETDRSTSEDLCEFVRTTTQLDLHREPGPQLAFLIQSIFNLEAVAIFDADLHKTSRAGEWFADLENVLWNTYFFESVTDNPETGQIRSVLRIGNLPIGALLLRGQISPVVGSAIACLVAITFDRFHSHANVSRTESARQTEQLRTTVLDNLAHAYKTPLAAIRAAGTGLIEMGHLTPAQSELVALINEQSEVLNGLSTRLLRTARLDAPDLSLRLENVAVAPLIDDVVTRFREQLASVAVKVSVLREDLSLCCDRELIVALLTQYLDNAGKYAVEGSTVTIEAAERPGEIVLSVHNTGPTVHPADQERIFDRYFRSAAYANKIPGTGIGLSVAKRAAQAHGGDVWVTSDDEKGTTFFASLRIAPKGFLS